MGDILKNCFAYDMNQPPEKIKKDIEELEKLLLSEGALDYKFTDEEIANSPIRNYFKGKTIFLTGGTGFLGQLLMEKLLRCEVMHIYLLARKKKNKTQQQRLDDIFNEIQFAKLKLLYPNFREHVSIIEGNMSIDKIGIKDSDIALLEDRVEIILHAAADVRFNNRIYDLVITNLRGTRELLKIAEHFKKLQMFHYISTAYSYCHAGKIIKEQFYEPPLDPNVIIAYVEQIANNTVEQEHLEYVTDRLIGKSPNTYTFSKCLSEELVRRSGEKIPICVSRPSIVISTNREPLPGWINNIYGLTGVITAVALGLSRVMPINRNIAANVICADFVINGILASTWSAHLDILEQKLASTQFLEIDFFRAWSAKPKTVAKVKTKEQRIFNIINTNSALNGTLLDVTENNYIKNPLKRIIWVICLNSTTSPFIFMYLSFFYHMLSSIFIDIGLKVAGQKDRVLPYSRKVQVFLKALSYFMLNEWSFEIGNMSRMFERMSAIDRKLFVCDTQLFDYPKWSCSYIQGAKRFIGQDDLLEPEKALKRYRRMQKIHFVVLIFFYASQLLIVYGLAKALGLVDYTQNTFQAVCAATRELLS